MEEFERYRRERGLVVFILIRQRTIYRLTIRLGLFLLKSRLLKESVNFTLAFFLW